jgi:hypothetical protein
MRIHFDFHYLPLLHRPARRGQPGGLGLPGKVHGRLPGPGQLPIHLPHRKKLRKLRFFGSRIFFLPAE